MNEMKKFAITLAVFAVLVIGLLVVLYMKIGEIGWAPLDKPDSLISKISAQEKKLKIANDSIDKIPGKTIELGKLKKDRKLAEQLIPEEIQEHVLLGFINEKQRTSGTRLLSLKPSWVKTKSGPVSRFMAPTTQSAVAYKEWNCALTITGTYDQIGGFINMMEEFEVTDNQKTFRQFFKVKDISLRAEKDGLVEGGTHKCELVVQTFKYTGDQETEAAFPGAKSPGVRP